MKRKWSNSEVQTGRRGFFRQLAISAIQTLEETGKAMAERSTRSFGQHQSGHNDGGSGSHHTPPDYSQYYHSPYTQFGPPWPPVLGPYIDLELRAKLRAEREAGELTAQSETEGPVAFDASENDSCSPEDTAPTDAEPSPETN